MKLARGTHGRPVELTLVALVDLLLLLVMYFILAGSFDRPRLIELAAGGGAAAAPAGAGEPPPRRPPPAALVRLRADGGADLNGEPLPAAEIAGRLAARPELGVLLRAAPDAALGDLVALLDALTAAGVRGVSLLDADLAPRP